jgi:hypothetical protein
MVVSGGVEFVNIGFMNKLLNNMWKYRTVSPNRESTYSYTPFCYRYTHQFLLHPLPLRSGNSQVPDGVRPVVTRYVVGDTPRGTCNFLQCFGGAELHYHHDAFGA